MLERLPRPSAARLGMVLLAVACTCSALAAAPAAAPAAAATTIGDNLEAIPTNQYFACGRGLAVEELPCTLTQTALGEGREAPGGLVAKSPGVVVRWRVRTGTALPDTTKALARLALVEGDQVGGERETAFTELPLDEPGIHTYPARLPIHAGERIALDAIVSGSGFEALPIGHEDSFVGSPAIWSPFLETGESRVAGSAPTDGEELLLNADVEPDADHDGYGDETQDECPGNPALHAGCKAPPPLTPAPARDTTPPATKLTYPPRQDFAGEGKVLVRVRSNEAATVTASGQLEVGSGPSKKGREIWGLTGVKRAVAAGAKTPLRLRLPKRTLEAARRKLAAGEKTVVKVVVTATDAAGNRSGATVAVIRPAKQH